MLHKVRSCDTFGVVRKTRMQTARRGYGFPARLHSGLGRKRTGLVGRTQKRGCISTHARTRRLRRGGHSSFRGRTETEIGASHFLTKRARFSVSGSPGRSSGACLPNAMSIRYCDRVSRASFERCWMKIPGQNKTPHYQQTSGPMRHRRARRKQRYSPPSKKHKVSTSAGGHCHEERFVEYHHRPVVKREFPCIESQNMIYLKWIQINIRTLGATPSFLWLLLRRKGDFRFSVRKDLYPGEVVLLFCKIMHPFHPRYRYKGAKPIWNWTLKDFIAYLFILALVILIDFLNKHL